MHDRKFVYHSLICGVLAFGILSVPARAESIEEDPAPGNPEAPTPKAAPKNAAPAQSDDHNAALQLPPVTVTAQRREQQSLDVPISMKTVDALDIEKQGARDLSDITQSTPNVSQWGDNASFGISSITIRGMGTQGGSMTGSDQGVGVYVDDIFVGSQAGMNPLLEDSRQIEILRGPQGTLYGRNAIGGAINILSNPPDETASGSASASYGTDALYEVHGHVNGKVADLSDGAISARLNAFRGGRDANVENSLDSNLGDYRKTGGKAQLRLRQGDVDTILRADYTDQAGSAWALAPFAEAPEHKVSYVNPFQYTVRDFGVSANSTIQFDQLKLQSITGWRGSDSDLDGGDWTASRSVQQGYDRRQRQVSQEFRLASDDTARLRWVSGLFLFYNNEFEYNFYGHRRGESALWGMFSNGEKERSRSTVETFSKALFGESTYALTDWLDGTLGGRLTHDQKSTQYSNDSQLGMAPALSVKQDIEHTDFSPKFSLSAKPDSLSQYYLSVSKGFKSGGFTREFAPTSKLDFKPERVWNFEVGAKNRLWGGRAETNLSFFYADWHNQQVSVSRIASGAIVNDVSNVPHSRSYGGEFEGSVRLTSDLTFGLGIGWTEATFLDFPNPTATLASGNGLRQPYAPRLTYSPNLQYLVNLHDDLDLLLRADYVYRTHFFHDITNQMQEPGYGVLNLKAGIETEGWDLSAFIKNVADQGYRTRALMYNGQAWAIAGDGRTLGVQATVRF